MSERRYQAILWADRPREGEPSWAAGQRARSPWSGKVKTQYKSTAEGPHGRWMPEAETGRDRYARLTPVIWDDQARRFWRMTDISDVWTEEMRQALRFLYSAGVIFEVGMDAESEAPFQTVPPQQSQFPISAAKEREFGATEAQQARWSNKGGPQHVSSPARAAAQAAGVATRKAPEPTSNPDDDIPF